MADIYWVFKDTGRTSYNDATRTATDYNAAGNSSEPRPYTAAENARADQTAAQATAQAAQAEFERALAMNAPAELEALQAANLVAEGIEQGDPWRQPTGAHDAYQLGSHVSHNGKDWESLVSTNVWEPGVSGWRQLVSTGYPEWVQPTGAHDDYDMGARVAHFGQNWESSINANVWEPGVYGWLTL